MDLFGIAHHEQTLKDHVEKFVHDKNGKHKFFDHLKEKVQELTHKHNLNDDEKKELNQLGQSHYEKVTKGTNMEPIQVEPKDEELSEDLPEVYLNHLDEDREVIEPIPLHEVSETLLDYLEKNELEEELEQIYEGEKSAARAKGFLNRIFVFKKLYSRKRDGEVDIFSKVLAYPPADVVNDLFFALDTKRGYPLD